MRARNPGQRNVTSPARLNHRFDRVFSDQPERGVRESGHTAAMATARAASAARES
jgi:hypothetical protein